MAPGRAYAPIRAPAAGDEMEAQKNSDSYRSESSYGEMRRSLGLPQDANVDGITASQRTGFCKSGSSHRKSRDRHRHHPVSRP